MSKVRHGEFRTPSPGRSKNDARRDVSRKKPPASERKRTSKFDESSSYSEEEPPPRPRQGSLPRRQDDPSKFRLPKSRPKPVRRGLASEDEEESVEDHYRAQSRRDRVISTPDAQRRCDDDIVPARSPLGRQSGPSYRIRPVTSLDLNAETDDIPIIEKKQSPRRAAASDDSDTAGGRRSSRDVIDPSPVEWSFPLRYVPRPTDTDQIVSDLNEKYSIVRLLTYVKNSST